MGNMRLLLVEDNLFRAAISARLLYGLDRLARRLEAITVASDLETALRCLPAHDTVLSDARFALSPGSRWLVEDWDVLRHEASRRGIHFVLYSGSARALDSARDTGTIALTKPATAEEIYAAVMGFSHPETHRAYREGDRAGEDKALAGY
jgi:hypothetical protein